MTMSGRRVCWVLMLVCGAAAGVDLGVGDQEDRSGLFAHLHRPYPNHPDPHYQHPPQEHVPHHPGHLAQIAAALNPLNVIPQVASALHPANVASNLVNNVPFIANKVNKHKHQLPPQTTTMYIQVTKTQTKYPVCMATASKVLPPCKVLAPPADHGHADHHYDANSAFHVGQGVGVMGQQLLNYPQLAQFAAYGAVPQGYAAYEQHVQEEQWHNQVREIYPELPAEADLEKAASEIKPTAVPKMPTSTATAAVESSRPKREVDEEGATVAQETAPLPKAEGSDRNPKYLEGFFAKPEPVRIPEVTKTVYVTKVEKLIDPHVTATVVPSNCIPDHVPLCPAHKPHYPHPVKPHHPVKPQQQQPHKYPAAPQQPYKH